MAGTQGCTEVGDSYFSLSLLHVYFGARLSDDSDANPTGLSENETLRGVALRVRRDNDQREGEISASVPGVNFSFSATFSNTGPDSGSTFAQESVHPEIRKDS